MQKLSGIVLLLVAIGSHQFATAQTNELIVPIVANGLIDRQTHFQSTFTVVNLSATAVDATLVVYDNEGKIRTGFLLCSPIAPPPDQLSLKLPPEGSTHSPSITDSQLVDGWARLTWTGAASLQLTNEVSLIKGEPRPCLAICNRPSTEIQSTTQVGTVRPGTKFRAAAMITPNRHTHFALVNPSETQTATVKVDALDASGKSFDSNEVKLGPRGRLSKSLWDLLILNKIFIMPPKKPGDFHGSVRITSDLPIAVGALHVLEPEIKFVNAPLEPGD